MLFVAALGDRFTVPPVALALSPLFDVVAEPEENFGSGGAVEFAGEVVTGAGILKKIKPSQN